MVEVNRCGCTRVVFLTGRHAVKLPNFLDGWRLFLKGLLANIQEREFAGAGLEGLCPISFSIPGGWVVVMPRADAMTRDEWFAFDAEAFCDCGDYVIPAENKASSFGRLDGCVVAVDYGN